MDVSSRVPILNGAIDPVTMAEAVDHTMCMLSRGERGWLATVNVAMLMMMRSDAKLQRFVDAAALIVPDGQPLVWAAGVSRRRLPERVAGIDLMAALCCRAAKSGVPVYLLGGPAGVAELAAGALSAQCPGLLVAGTGDGYFDDADARARAELVRDSGAKVLFVGMGTPRQECFISDHWEELGVGVAIPVGGSLEVFSGRKRRAPRLLQRTGLEWAFRLAQEPRRLSRRYFVTGLQFLALLARQLTQPR